MYRLALEAAKRSDATKLMTLAADIPDYAHYNEQRHAVQLLDCQSKNVIVSLPFELRGGSLAARAN